jgi:Ca2+-binding RTX toxin-like protein
VVGGGAHNSTISVANNEGPHQLVVLIADRGSGQSELHQAFDDTVNGVAVGRVMVYGQASDQITVASSICLTSELYAGNGGAVLQGGGGTNILVGGDGDDILIGGGGRGILIGGLGRDCLRGGDGDDLLIAARTDWDHNSLALRSILNEWTSGHDYAMRVANITNGSGGGGLNGGFYLNTSTVHDDGSIDTLYGEAGRDWFIDHASGATGSLDQLQDRASNELQTTV